MNGTRLKEKISLVRLTDASSNGTVRFVVGVKDEQKRKEI